MSTPYVISHREHKRPVETSGEIGASSGIPKMRARTVTHGRSAYRKSKPLGCDEVMH